MIGRGPVMQDLFGMIRRLAPHVRTALVTGESGTGKELVARALHKAGPRRDRRFVTVNCSAAIETLFESELFGHVRRRVHRRRRQRAGAVRAGRRRDAVPGRESASCRRRCRPSCCGSWSSAKCLAWARSSRAGSTSSVIAATNRDLRAEVAAGRFRSDLYYRLSIVEVKVPALRERREDIPYLTAAFVRETSERLQKPLLALTRAAERMLTRAPWDGNVRELRNVIERVSILAHGAFITERELAISLPVHAPARPGPGLPAMTPFRPPASDDSDLLVNVERDHIQRALARSNGNKKAAAKMLGLSRRALYRRLERLDLSSTISRRRDGAALAEA